jgi:hypothetical protein
MAIPTIVDRLTLEQAVQSQFTSTTGVEYTLTAIALVEADINTRVRVRHQMGRSRADLSDQFTAWPSDCLGMVGIQLNTNPVRKLEFLKPDMMDVKRSEYSSVGVPQFFSIIADEIELLPAPDDTYQAELTYYKRLDALDADDATNWLVTYYPHIYFTGTAAKVAEYVGDARATFWGGQYSDLLESLIIEDSQSRYPSGSLNAYPKQAFS